MRLINIKRSNSELEYSRCLKCIVTEKSTVENSVSVMFVDIRPAQINESKFEGCVRYDHIPIATEYFLDVYSHRIINSLTSPVIYLPDTGRYLYGITPWPSQMRSEETAGRFYISVDFVKRKAEFVILDEKMSSLVKRFTQDSGFTHFFKNKFAMLAISSKPYLICDVFNSSGYGLSYTFKLDTES